MQKRTIRSKIKFIIAILRFAKQIIMSKILKKRIPIIVSFHITNKCNLRCRYCYANFDGRFDSKIPDFTTSEVCASGAGRFIEIISAVLQIPLSELNNLSMKSSNPVTFSTGCAVFGESEAVSRIAEGFPPEDIISGVYNSLAEKIISMVNRIGLKQKCTICGGGALNSGLVKWVEKKLDVKLAIPPQPHLINAFGAAIVAREVYETK